MTPYKIAISKLCRGELLICSGFYGLADRTVLITKEGLKIPVDIIGSTIKDDRDNIIGIVVSFYDIIERNRIDEKLKSH